MGVLHRNDRFPHLYWQNFLSVDPAQELSADVLEPFRGRGLARVLVGGAVERIRRDGCDPIFVVANDKSTTVRNPVGAARQNSRSGPAAQW